MAENYFGLSDVGKLRDNNEDAFIAEKLPTGWILACVIDGVGGYDGGEVAAAIARDTLLQKMQAANGDVLQILREALLQANQNIYREKQEGKGNSQMACVLTVVLADVESNQFFYAHVGDTRLYLLRDHSLVKVTKDQSFVGFLEDSGRLSEEEAMTHPKRNEINKALGFDAQMDLKDDYIETGQSPFLPGDLLLLCSDGLTDLVNNKAMSDVLLSSATLAQKGKALIDAANGAGGKDNITVVLVKNDKKPQKQKATKPVLVKKNAAVKDEKPTTILAETREEAKPVTKAKKNNLPLWLFGLLLLLLALACFWFWTKNKDLQASLPKPVLQPVRNAEEKRFGDSLGLASQTFVYADSLHKNIIVSDTVFARQDSLHINGNGLVLQSDSAYRGPAFVVSSNNKYLLLENITFKGFHTAIVAKGKGVQLKNVRFENCDATINRQFQLPLSQPLTGILRDTVILKKDTAAFKKDSLPK
ncbi:PP2C family protein-serine/threonine phosphatase [Flavisolibacter ginsenosidimutans]|uniref:Serine/threonine-protein phosphatase n=1 Tax=Flavisolibacter ginsenosidimutans TaxID=661481 RepID=A0A5B8UIJ9_9BACT|nr:protein phosphatase 2C domain-containing protein [Flavisolibacter ginsenosidimutans]QEC55930.1 serine/threonine-protein phosphatase [Flavisolibacter ginsenosidimutans]